MSKLFTVGADRKLVERTPDGRGMSMPVGSLMMFAGSTPPESWMICDGSEISRTTFVALFDVIGVTYGQGDGSTTFNLPDLRGRFVQGATVAGDVREAGLPNITGSAKYGAYFGLVSSAGVTSGAFKTGLTQLSYQLNGAESPSYELVFDAGLSNSIYGKSPTVQPPAVTMIPCIKAFGSVVNETGISVADLAARIASLEARIS